MIKAFLFDMDGTLVDSLPLHIEAWIETLDKYNILVDKSLINEVNGMSTPMIADYIVKKYNLTINPANIALMKRAISMNKLKKGVKLFDNTLKTLVFLKKLGFFVCLATSSKLKHVELSLGSNLDFEFDKIVTQDDVKLAKPNPDIFLKCSELLNIEPESCVVVEDSINGIIAAKKAKMKTIAITNSTDSNYLKDADIIISNLKEINSNLINKLNDN